MASVGGGGGGSAAASGAIDNEATDSEDPAALLRDAEPGDGLPGGGRP